MGYTSYLMLLLCFMLAACEEDNPVPDNFSCQTASLDANNTYQDLIGELPEEFIRRIPESPNEVGALGRNKEVYFHVRFQLKMTCLSDFALRFEDIDALDAFFNSMDYAFSYQRAKGDFEIVVPQALRNSANYPPRATDLASGTAFFAYSLGLALNSLQTSSWFNTEPGLDKYREALIGYSSKFSQLLFFFKRK